MQLHQLDHMQTICTSLQTDNYTITSSLRLEQIGANSSVFIITRSEEDVNVAGCLADCRLLRECSALWRSLVQPSRLSRPIRRARYTTRPLVFLSSFRDFSTVVSLGTSLLSACCMGWFRWELLCCYWLRIDCKYIVVVGRVFLQYCGSLFHEFRSRLLFFCRLHGVWLMFSEGLLGCIVLQRIRCGMLSVTNILLSACLSVCWSQPHTLQKRLNQSKCQLGYGIGWDQGTTY